MSNDSPPYPDTKPKSTRLTPRLMKLIDEFVVAGLYINHTAVIRQAIIEFYKNNSHLLRGGN
ncbi:MAG: hypothetical protein HGN29_09260 [Asgard group archaeon]|nr:hypothetical protein [Asgard group archaeon]